MYDLKKRNKKKWRNCTRWSGFKFVKHLVVVQGLKNYVTVTTDVSAAKNYSFFCAICHIDEHIEHNFQTRKTVMRSWQPNSRHKSPGAAFQIAQEFQPDIHFTFVSRKNIYIKLMLCQYIGCCLFHYLYESNMTSDFFHEPRTKQILAFYYQLIRQKIYIRNTMNMFFIV
jgi:hypothetical protein